MSILSVKGQSFVSRIPTDSVVGTVNAERVQFAVDGSWKGLSIFAVFKNEAITDQEPVPILLDESLACDVPWQVLVKPGKILVGLLGKNGSDVVKPTMWLEYSNASNQVPPNGGVDPGGKPAKDALDQMVEIQRQTKAVAQSVRDDAAQGKFDGKPGKNGEPGKSPKEEGGTWWLWNEGEQKWVDTGILVAGKNGISPKVATQPVTGGTRVIITDADGEKSFDVLNGKNGDPGKKWRNA